MSGYQSGGCDCCGQFPYIASTGMCPVCTFGEADAMQDALDGNMSGLVWERESQEKPQQLKSPKETAYDKTAKLLDSLGFSCRLYAGYQINIDTPQGLVVYWSGTQRVRHNGKTQKLRYVNKNHDGDIVGYLRELSK